MLICTAVLVLLIVALLFHFYIPRFITEIRNPLVELIKYKHHNFDGISYNPAKGKNIAFKTHDGLILKAFITYAETDKAKATIILLHGIRSRKEFFIEQSQQLAQAGYHAVALDLRAHGESEGKNCTYGVNEKLDVQALVKYLKTEEVIEMPVETPIGIWGISLGGAIGLQTMGLEKDIEFGIIESTFTDFKTITNDYVTRYLGGIEIKPLVHYAVNRAASMQNFKPEEVRPVDYCKMIEQPTLMVHGNKDIHIKPAYGKENFNQLKSEKKQFLEIESATHLNVWEAGGDAYFKQVLRFIESNL